MVDKPEIMVSCEDPDTTYLCYRDMRFIFRGDEYVGWYRPYIDEERACGNVGSPSFIF